MKTEKPVIMIDFGGVYFTNGGKIAIEKISKKFNMPKKRIESVTRISKSPYRKKYAEGKITGKEFWRHAAKTLNISSKQAREMELIWHKSFIPQPGMKKLIQKLRRKYKVVALSGNLKERVRFLDKKYKLENLFDEQHYSFHYGVNKPDVRFFKHAVRKIGARYEDCIVIDDLKNFLSSVRKNRRKVHTLQRRTAA